MSMINYKAKHFNYKTDNGIAVISIKGAKQKNPLFFESQKRLSMHHYKNYVALRDLLALIE